MISDSWTIRVKILRGEAGGDWNSRETMLREAGEGGPTGKTFRIKPREVMAAERSRVWFMGWKKWPCWSAVGPEPCDLLWWLWPSSLTFRLLRWDRVVQTPINTDYKRTLCLCAAGMMLFKYITPVTVLNGMEGIGSFYMCNSALMSHCSWLIS